MLGALVPEMIPSLETAKTMGLSAGRLARPLRTGGPGAERAGLSLSGWPLWRRTTQWTFTYGPDCYIPRL